MIIDINTTEPKPLIYDYTISANDKELTSIEARFIIILEGFALTIQGQFIEHDRIKVEIPPLTELIKDTPKNKEKIQYRFEMIFNDHEILTVDTGTILIESKPVIKTSKPKTFEAKKIIPIRTKKLEVKKSKFAKSFEVFVKEREKE